MQYRAHTILKTILLISGIIVSSVCEAAPFKPRDTKIAPSDIFLVPVTFLVKKKSYSRTVSCMSGTTGKSYTKKAVLYFRTLQDDLKLIGQDLKKNARNKTKLASLKKKQQQLKALIKASINSCYIPPQNNNPSQPPSAPQNPVLPAEFLDPYTGEFGVLQARHLLNRFGMGANSTEVDSAVSRGLQATVDQLLTWKNEPEIDTYGSDLECDGRDPSDPNNESCNTANNNDLDVSGFRYSWYYGALKSQNQLFYRLFLMLHDDFMSANSNSLEWCDRHAIRTYQQMLWRAAKSGDFKQFLNEYMTDQLGALRYLNLGSRRAPVPNQNFARELWQLGSVGQNRVSTGELNYDELDVISASNVLAGWSMEYYENQFNEWVCYGAKVPGLSVPGRQYVFHGTPYQTLVSNPAELLEATLRHPATSENIANKLYLQFVNPEKSEPAVILHLAKIIRENGFNINAAVRQLMLSKGFFDPANFRTQIKHPLQLIIGFLRQSRVPFDSYWQLEEIFSSLGQRPYQPDSVFGWYPERLAGEAYILERRNSFNWLNTQGDSFYQEHGFNYFDTYLSNIPAGQAPAPVVISRVTNALGLTINQAQTAQLNEYLNMRLTTSGCPAQCGGQATRSINDTFNPASSSTGNWGRQIRGLLIILASLPQYQVI